MSYQSKSFLILVVLVVSTALVFATSNGAWLNKVPERDRDKVR